MAQDEAQPGTIRTFISVHLAPTLADELERLQQKLRLDGVRWTRRGQLHLTLKFLGDIPASSASEVEAALRRACQGVRPFRLTLQGLGCFPNPQRPSVVWVGIGGDVSVLKSLHAAVERETAVFAEKNEKRDFHPHLTIGRVKNVPFRELQRLSELVQSAQVGALGEWTVDAAHLMQSDLLPEGARHTELANVRLE